MTPRTRYSFFIDDELAKGLKVLKARDGTPEAEAIRRAIGDYLKARGVTVGTKTPRKRGRTRKRG
jgi:Ribbon-helix-helix protein, copG family